MSSVVTITVTNDADFKKTFQYTSVDAVPIDLTGASLEMMLRRKARDDVALMRLGTDTGEIVLTDAVNGFFSMLIKQLELERLGLGEYEHSLIMTRGAAKTKIWYGTLINNPGPTR